MRNTVDIGLKIKSQRCDYSARRVKRLKATTFKSASISLSTSRTDFLASKMSSWLSKHTSFKNLPRRPLAMF